MNANEIARELESHAAEVASYLLPQGKKAGPEWKAGSVRGEPGQSLSVRIGGAKKGVWRDFATGDNGDLLDLWAAVRGLSVAEAMREAAGYLGIRLEMPSKAPNRPYKRPEKPRASSPKGRGLEWLKSRGLTDATIAAFKVAEKVEGGKTFVVFPYLRDGEFVNAKLRNVEDKRDMRQLPSAEPCLFGWHLIEPKCRKVIIAEGEIDAMTLHQAGLPALSPNAGAGNFQWLESDWERLDRFSEIVIAYDTDEAGQKGTQELVRRLGVDRVRVCSFPGYKDANEALQAGEDGEFFWHAVRSAKSVDPEGLQSFGDFLDRVRSMFYPAQGQESEGYPFEIGDRRYDWLNFRKGEITVWTGTNGHGKSQFIAQVAVQTGRHGARWCVFSGEMTPWTQLKRLVKIAGGVDKPTIAYLDQIGEWIADRMWVVSRVGSMAVEPLIELFAYAHRRYGCDSFMVDSLMMLDLPEDGNGAFTAQKKAIQLLADFAKRYGVHVHLVAHPRKGRDEKDAPGKMDVAGSSKITDGADNVLSVWSAKHDTKAHDYDPEKPDGFVTLYKQRNGDVQERAVAVWSIEGSRQFSPDKHRRNVQMVDFDRETEAA